ncbi:MAG: hypothetical protein H6861_02445 [Rhodospirillales bacterium]|nr:hypothetical protein [Rhodospirillales bacterium]
MVSQILDRFTRLTGLGALALISLAAQPVWASDALTKLTQDNVKAFIEETTDITSSNRNGLSPKTIQDYLDQHLDKKAHFKSVMKYHIPGMPVQETQLSLDKEGFMDSVGKGAETIEGYDTLVEIEDIKISSDGEKAFVKTRNTEYATMPVPTETGGTQGVPMEGVSECSQILLLKKGVIKMYNANCVTNIEFMEY